MTPVFVETGKDLYLEVKEPVTLTEGSDFIWKVNGSDKIVRYTGDKTYFYGERAQFFEQNFSLVLRNVQKNDSGDYTADVSGKVDVTVAEYQVTVQGKFLNISNVDTQQQYAVS